MLYNPDTVNTPDRTKTMLAFHAKFTKYDELTPAAKSLIVWRMAMRLTKHRILACCNEEKTHLILPTGANGTLQSYQIVWENNNYPTWEEWIKIAPGRILGCDLRVTLVADRIAVLALQ